ncbi:MAG: 4-(cytidine 5'-diphospho)-2-C-methyl-D-erythritol kinase [Micrococcales bacterium]
MSELSKSTHKIQYSFTKYLACAEGPLQLILADVDRWPGNLNPRLMSNSEHEMVVAFRDNSRARIRLAKIAGGVNRIEIELEAAPNTATGVDYEIFWFELFESLQSRLLPEQIAVATAPGKVNLFFQVGPLKEDGYHDVASLYLAVNLTETVVGQITTEYSVKVSGSLDEFALLAVPTDESNLVVKVAKQIKALSATPEVLKLQLGIDKHVPVAGGMGGGSADAAAALLVSDALFRTELSSEQLHSIAATLGADVPFALTGGVAIGTGNGDQLTPIENVKPIHLVVIGDQGGLSTPLVYQRLDALRAARGENPKQVVSPEVDQALIRALQSGNAYEIAELLHNDLEEATLSLRPDLETRMIAARQLGALKVMVSGSGPTVLAFCGSESGAKEIAEKLVKLGYLAQAVSGPALGAELIG